MSPNRNETLPLSVFELDGTPEDYAWFGAQNVEYGYKSAICVEPRLRLLLASGESFGREDLERRLRLKVNGIDQGRPDHIFMFLQSITYTLPGGGTAESMEDSPACWIVSLDAGIHQAIVEFERPNGEFRSYEWYFALVDDREGEP